MKKLLVIIGIIFTGILFNACSEDLAPDPVMDLTVTYKGQEQRKISNNTEITIYKYRAELVVTGGVGFYSLKTRDGDGSPANYKNNCSYGEVQYRDYIYTKPGTYTFSAEIEDIDGNVFSASQTVTTP